MKVMRKNKLGSVSPCSCSDDKVGKGRCNHIIGDSDVNIVYNKDEKCYYVDLSKNDEKVSIKAQEKVVKDFICNLENSLSDDNKDKILKLLRAK